MDRMECDETRAEIVCVFFSQKKNEYNKPMDNFIFNKNNNKKENVITLTSNRKGIN